jgi:hypothetical protein
MLLACIGGWSSPKFNNFRFHNFLQPPFLYNGDVLAWMYISVHVVCTGAICARAGHGYICKQQLESDARNVLSLFRVRLALRFAAQFNCSLFIKCLCMALHIDKGQGADFCGLVNVVPLPCSSRRLC